MSALPENAATPRRTDRPGLFEAATIAASLVRAAVTLRGTKRGERVRCFGLLDVPQRDGVVIGQRAVFLDGPVHTTLRCARGAELVVGERTVCNHGVAIISNGSVRIGRDCLIASFVHIRDGDGRRTSPVVVGNDVWIAHGAVLEPGAVVGDGSVIATMAVVYGVVPPRSMAAGNPARCLPLDAEIRPEEPARPGGDRPHPGVRPDQVRTAIIEWLDDTRLFGDSATRITSDTMALREGGLLDSLGTVELVSMLEERFGVVLAREHAVRPETQSLTAFVELVMRAGPGPG
jgi:maltose O-acetyltransferase